MDRVTEILGSPYFLVTSLLLFLIYVFYRVFYLPHLYFKRLGIAGPRPVPLLGNIGLFWKSGGSFSKVQTSLVQKYGKVSSLYYGTTGGLLVADPDMIKEIMIKQFDKFNDRYFGSSSPVTIGEDNVRTIDVVKGEDWRRRRRILSPAFSAHKLKLMVPLLSDSTNRLVEVCSEKADNGDLVDVYDLFSKLTMEIILSCAFGCNVDVQKGAGNKLYKTAMDVMAQFNLEDRVYLMMTLLADAYPLFVHLNNLIERLTNARDTLDKLVEASRFVVEKRKKDMEAGNDQRKDLLQLLFEASKQDDHKFLTDGEMVAEIMFILLAGYDTTSNTLAFTAYLLAINTEIQEKLANMILEYFDDNPDNTVLDAANDLEYVGMVISEAQRMFPPVVFTDRVCTESCVVNGIPFKKGMFAVIPVRDIHQDPDLWPSPEQFDPERFTAEERAKRHPCAYLPFGLGPRNCVGMRFALMEAKMALIEIVRNFKIVRLPETKVPLETKGLFVQSPKEGTAVVKLQKRE